MSSDTERAVLDAIDAAHREGAIWIPFLSGRRSLFDGIETIWKKRYPERRNRPTYRNVERVLSRLVADGTIERKVGDRLGEMYRRIP